MADSIYVALGDSTGAGVGATSGGGYPQRLVARLSEKLKLVNLCQSGATSADVLRDQLPRALRTEPRLVTLGIGINDIGLQVPDDAFAVTLEEIAVALARLETAVVICNVPDLALSPAVARLVPASLYEKRIQMFNEHITASAARHGFTLVDLYSWSREALPGRPELFSPDGFHPSAEGYEGWAERMAPAVGALLSGSRRIPA